MCVYVCVCVCVCIYIYIYIFPDGSVIKNLPGDLGPIPESGGSPGEGNGNPLQYSCLENPMDRGAWWATVHGITEAVRHELVIQQ